MTCVLAAGALAVSACSAVARVSVGTGGTQVSGASSLLQQPKGPHVLQLEKPAFWNREVRHVRLPRLSSGPAELSAWSIKRSTRLKAVVDLNVTVENTQSGEHPKASGGFT